MADAIRVKGLRELNRALRDVDKDVRLGVRREFRTIAEPVKNEAETLANLGILNVGNDWSRMRVGQSLDRVYVVPRGRRSKNPRLRRPNLKPLLLDRALEPALSRNADKIEGEFGRMLDRVADNFSK